ncbi:MAG: hypothetical protein F9K44_11195 [Hyphomicrobiaceae bacterium]|jgi:hypothetical protein|nr:MAG: hypothetical protein F9K44_11195 [Hyphomicrobiaceae bacterium]
MTHRISTSPLAAPPRILALAFVVLFAATAASAQSAAVLGTSTNLTAVRGNSTNNFGIFGVSEQSAAAVGQSGGAASDDYGLWGYAEGGYGAQITSNNYRGMYADGDYDAAAGSGIWFDAVFAGDVGIDVNGACTGCVVASLVRNDGALALEPGDLVAVNGISANLDPGSARPMMTVERYTGGEGLIGVVFKGYVSELVEFEVQPAAGLPEGEVPEIRERESGHVRDGAIAPGDYLIIVHQGMAEVHVDGSGERVGAGSTLVAGTDGVALTGTEGLRIGRALESSRGDGRVWAFVDIR